MIFVPTLLAIAFAAAIAWRGARAVNGLAGALAARGPRG